MSDYGVRFTDQEELYLEKRIRQVYSRAYRELIHRLEEHKAKFAVKDAAKKAEIAGAKTAAEKRALQKEYREWLNGQVFIGRQWEHKVDEVAKTMTAANKEAMNIIRDGQIRVFAENANYEAYLLEKGARASFGFELYSEKAVTRLLAKSPTLLPKWKIDQPKDYVWNYGKVKDIVTQGIIQGEGIPEITKKLAVDICSRNASKMRTFARTSMTGAQNAGRIERMEEAQEMGIKTRKKWVATLDSRTRDAHQDLDGQTAEVDEPFHSELGNIMYPGDPSADPANVYNCRCTLESVVVGYENHGQRRAYRETEDGKRESYTIDGDITYKEWKKLKGGD